MNIRLINLAVVLQVLLSAVNQYFILLWAVRFTKATSSLKIKLMNSCRNTLYPLQNIKKCCSSSFWFCLQTKHLLSSTGMETPQISYFAVCIRVLNLKKHNFGHWANFGTCWLRTARQFSHACGGRQIKSYHLLLVCPRDSPNIWCKFSHTSPDLLIRSGQVKKTVFLFRRASERAQEECSKFCLLEWAPQRLLFFDFNQCESYLRAALFRLNAIELCFSKGCRGTNLCPTLI